MVSDADHQAVVEFLYREARLADEARYAEWLALWTDDGVYWVPATTDPDADPEQAHLAHLRQPRAPRDPRQAAPDRPPLQPGARVARCGGSSPISRRRKAEDGELVAESNFVLAELSIQAKHEMHWWVGRATHRLRRVDGALRMSGKKVVLINAAEPLPNLSFLI